MYRPDRSILTAAAIASALAAQDPALTIYNQDFAVVRERLALDLKAGANAIAFRGVTTQVEPDSVVLRDPTGAVPLAVLEQSYRADTLSQGMLLALHEGKELEFLVAGRDGEQRVVRGRVVRSGWVPGQGRTRRGGQQQWQQHYVDPSQLPSPIVEVDGKLRFSLPGQPLFPALGDDAVLVPTLDWLVHTEQAVQVQAELSYVTGGMSWEASYNLVAPEHGDTLDLVGWVTIDNASGKVWKHATVKLMAGDVHKLQPGEGGAELDAGALMAMERKAGAPRVTEKAFDEFHLYSLPQPTTLYDRQTKQVEFVRGAGVKAPVIYVYDGASLRQYRGLPAEAIRTQPDYGTHANTKVWVMREFENTEQNGLGMPLPAGRTRFYRRDDADGRLEFTGENVIDHTAKNERVRIYTGDAFDVVGERKRTHFSLSNANDQLEEAFEIRVRNRKATAIEVRVAERLYRWLNWHVTAKSHEFTRTDAQRIEFRVTVAPDAEQVVTYRVRYDWQ